MGEDQKREVEVRAREWLRRRQTGDIDPSQILRSDDGTLAALIAQAERDDPDLAIRLRRGLTLPGSFAGIDGIGMVPQLAALGEPTAFELLYSRLDRFGFVQCDYRVAFANGTSMKYSFGLSPNGKVNKLGYASIAGEPSPFEPARF
jgi:hypothetical protein